MSAEPRRSDRVATKGVKRYSEGDEGDAPADEHEEDAAYQEDEEEFDGAAAEGSPALKKQRSAPRVVSARSTKTLMANISRFNDSLLGRFVDPAGTSKIKKLSVMLQAVNDMQPQFNKYASMVEWINCVFLFINIGGDQYKNLFFDGGRQMTWFATPKQRETSDGLQRLIRGTDPVLLFCRPVGEPYVYCGQVRYKKHDPDASPIEFTFELQDFERLCQVSLDPTGINVLDRIMGVNDTDEQTEDDATPS